MIAVAVAAALCAANVALWSTLIAAARATDREARARWDAARHARDSAGRFTDAHAVCRAPSGFVANYTGVARGEAGQGGQAID
jgi:hypothetical protein